jgi:uncharacterized membrane protein YgcG
MPNEKFYSLAEKCGLNTQSLKAGKTEVSEHTFNTVEEIKAFIDSIGGPAKGQSESRVNFSADKTYTDQNTVGKEQSLVHRLHDHIYSGNNLTDKDRADIKGGFPVKLSVLGQENMCIQTNKGFTIDKTGHDVYVIGTLTLCPGAFIKIVSHPVTIHITTIVKHDTVDGKPVCTGKACDPVSGSSPKEYDIAILGSTGAVGPTGVPQTGIPNPGPAGTDGVCGTSSPVTNATIGIKGNTGFAGNQPNLILSMNGQPNQPAKIIINGLTGSGAEEFTIVSKSGTGGRGGTGGKGGSGSQGGRGGYAAVYCACITTGGQGGPGGRGGRGGTGGIGGNGTDGMESHLLAPQAVLDMITIIDTRTVPPGEGGPGGGGGAGGIGGVGAPAVSGSTNSSPAQINGATGGGGPFGQQGAGNGKSGNPGKIKPQSISS